MKSLKIWTNFPPLRQDATDLMELLASYPIHVSSVQGPDPALADAEIAFGQPDPQQVIDLPRLKWVHLNTAGYTPYDREDLRRALRARGAALTNSSGVFDDPCAEHALSMILALSRGLPLAMDNQRGPQEWPSALLRGRSRLLRGQTILLIGYGAIASRLAGLLAPFGAKVVGFRRQPRGDEAVPCHPMSAVNDWLGQADHIVNMLPGSTQTDQFFDADRFAKMRRSAFFYNIGRGTTVDQVALRVALETSHIAAAYLDVMTPEPLPKHDPLWTTPHCYLTPHTAGGRDDETPRLMEHFLENLKRYERGEPLENRIV